MFAYEVSKNQAGVDCAVPLNSSELISVENVESGDQPTDLGSALLSSRMVGVYRA